MFNRRNRLLMRENFFWSTAANSVIFCISFGRLSSFLRVVCLIYLEKWPGSKSTFSRKKEKPVESFSFPVYSPYHCIKSANSLKLVCKKSNAVFGMIPNQTVAMTQIIRTTPMPAGILIFSVVSAGRKNICVMIPK